MNVGEPCPLLRNWTIVAFRDNCPEHDCQRFDLLEPKKKYPYRNVCPKCFRRKRNQEGRRARFRQGIRQRRHAIVDYDGQAWLGEPEHDLWKAEYDRKIDLFWAKRGMTDDLAKIKFGVRIRYPGVRRVKT